MTHKENYISKKELLDQIKNLKAELILLSEELAKYQLGLKDDHNESTI